MSRKQEIYRQILSWALPSTRNCLSHFRQSSLPKLLSPKRQCYLRDQFEVAEFVHNIYVSILEEKFTHHDIHFLNFQARAFFQRNDDRCLNYSLFAYYIQELFKEVPEDRRYELDWDGPRGDFSWARPKRGGEFDDGLSTSSTRIKQNGKRQFRARRFIEYLRFTLRRRASRLCRTKPCRRC